MVFKIKTQELIIYINNILKNKILKLLQTTNDKYKILDNFENFEKNLIDNIINNIINNIIINNLI